ncbi:MAG: type III-B CRISPR module RAMP protein Cmr1 [Infirmifilum sp.]
MSRLGELQEKLRRNDQLVEVNAALLLPRIGGYKASPFSKDLRLYEPPRPSEFKALWRWWLRVAASAAFKGQRKYDELDVKVEKYLGSTKQRSLFTINVEVDSREDLDDLVSAVTCILEEYKRVKRNRGDELKELLDNLKRYYYSCQQKKNFPKTISLEKLREVFECVNNTMERIPRYKLLLMGANLEKKIEEAIAFYLACNGCRESTTMDCRIPLRVKLFLDVSHSKISANELRFCVATFLLSMVLGGVGSITKRGFGSIIVSDVKFNDEYEWLREEKKMFNNILGAQDAQQLKANIEEYVRHVSNLAASIYSSNREKIPEGMPKVPTLLPERYFKIEVLDCSNKDTVSILECIGNATLKQKWKEKEKASATSLYTWILGLPRAKLSKKDNKLIVETGYFLYGKTEDAGRRASAIGFKVWEGQNKKYIIIYGFLSNDWPVKELYLRRFPRKAGEAVLESKELKGKNPEEALEIVFQKAFQTTRDLVEKCCGSRRG